MMLCCFTAARSARKEVKAEAPSLNFSSSPPCGEVQTRSGPLALLHPGRARPVFLSPFGARLLRYHLPCRRAGQHGCFG